MMPKRNILRAARGSSSMSEFKARSTRALDEKISNHKEKADKAARLNRAAAKEARLAAQAGRYGTQLSIALRRKPKIFPFETGVRH